MTHESSNIPQWLKDLIDRGAEITGGSIGTAIGFLSAGTPGAIAGGAAGTAIAYTLQKTITEIAQRLLGNREKARLGATIQFTAEKIQENLKNGMKVRDDGFFEKQLNERTTADEIFEGVLLAAQREHQEKKVRFYSNLLANIAFHSEINRAQANLLIRLAARLSYRQLCVLSLFAQKNKFRLKQEDYRGAGNIEISKASLLQEIFELYSQGMLNASGEALLGLGDIPPAKMNVQGTGALLYNLMELSNVAITDLNEIALLLQ